MKKKVVTLCLMLAITLSACGSTPKVDETKPTTTVSETGSSKEEGDTAKENNSFDDKEIEKRIDSMADAYDGLYEYEDYDGMVSKGFGGIFNTMGSTDAMVSAEVAEESVAAPAAESYGDMEEMPIVIPDPYYEDVDWNREGYNAVKENGFVSVKTQPFSTFGADVDTATYSNLRRTIFEGGYGLESSAIRVEELIKRQMRNEEEN